MPRKKLEPNIVQMLRVGRDCGLKTVGEAYQNYLRHYDCFFLIAEFGEQNSAFTDQLRASDLLAEPSHVSFRDISISEGLKSLQALKPQISSRGPGGFTLTTPEVLPSGLKKAMKELAEAEWRLILETQESRWTFLGFAQHVLDQGKSVELAQQAIEGLEGWYRD